MKNAPRKFISIFLVVLMLASMLPTTVFAATAPKVAAASVEKEMIAGETVDVDITLSDNPGIVGGTVKIEFEKTKLKLTSVKNTSQTITSTYNGYSVMPITSGNYTLEKAQLSLNQAQRSYASTTDRQYAKAPVSGTVYSLNVKVDDEVRQGDVVAVVRDSSVMALKLPFPADDAAGSYVGQSAAITLDSTFETLSGTVAEISGTNIVGEGNTITRNVTIMVSNPGGSTDTQAASAVINGLSCAASGTFTYRSDREVTASASGTVTAIYAPEGSHVSKDQIILSLGGSTLEDQLQTATDDLRSAELSMEGTQEQLDNDDHRAFSERYGTGLRDRFGQDPFHRQRGGDVSALRDGRQLYGQRGDAAARHGRCGRGRRDRGRGRDGVLRRRTVLPQGCDGKRRCRPTVSVICTDGVERSFPVDEAASYSTGRLVSVDVTGNGTTIRQLSERSLSGKVASDGSRFGGYDFAAKVKLLDTSGTGTAVAVEPERLAGCSLSSSAARCYVLNEKDEIEHLILKDVTGDTWTYAYLYSVKDASSDMAIDVTYRYLIDGEEALLRSSSTRYPVRSGGIGISYESDGTISSMQQLSSVGLTDLNVSSAMAGRSVRSSPPSGDPNGRRGSGPREERRSDDRQAWVHLVYFPLI